MLTDMLSCIYMLKSKHLSIYPIQNTKKKKQAKWAKWARILTNIFTDEQLCLMTCFLACRWGHILKSMRAYLEVNDGIPWCWWWHTLTLMMRKSWSQWQKLKSMMAFLDVDDGKCWSHWWHTLKLMMAYIEVDDGIHWSWWWYTLKLMMVYIEVDDGIH